MAHKFTEEQLNSADRALLIQMILNLQDQSEALTKEVHDLNEKMQLMMEQLVLAKKDRFGRSSEKMLWNMFCCIYFGNKKRSEIYTKVK